MLQNEYLRYLIAFYVFYLSLSSHYDSLDESDIVD